MSIDSWIRLEAMMNVSTRTGHSSFYIEKGKNVLVKTGDQLGESILSCIEHAIKWDG